MNDPHSSPAAVNPTKHVGGMLIIAALALTVVGLTNGRMVAEKVVTDMAMPCGVVWIALTMLCYFTLVMGQRFLFLMSFLTWLLFSLSSNNLVANRLLDTLEDEYVLSRPLLVNEPYDSLVVLGGGSTLAANGELQLGVSGDRIALAARMYHAGRTHRIICTGSRIAPLSTAGRLDAGEETRAILQSLNVPAEAIQSLPGRNTSEEIAHLAELLAEQPSARIGLLTSAWHLPRAMRLARAANLELEPVPADFKTSRQKITVRSFVPSDSALTKTRVALRECLAKLVNR